MQCTALYGVSFPLLKNITRWKHNKKKAAASDGKQWFLMLYENCWVFCFWFCFGWQFGLNANKDLLSFEVELEISLVYRAMYFIYWFLLWIEEFHFRKFITDAEQVVPILCFTHSLIYDDINVFNPMWKHWTWIYNPYLCWRDERKRFIWIIMNTMICTPWNVFMPYFERILHIKMLIWN